MSRKLLGAALGGGLLILPQLAAAHVTLETSKAPGQRLV